MRDSSGVFMYNSEWYDSYYKLLHARRLWLYGYLKIRRANII